MTVPGLVGRPKRGQQRVVDVWTGLSVVCFPTIQDVGGGGGHTDAHARSSPDLDNCRGKERARLVYLRPPCTQHATCLSPSVCDQGG